MPSPTPFPGGVVGEFPGFFFFACVVDLDGVVSLGRGVVLDEVLGAMTLFRLGIGLDT